MCVLYELGLCDVCYAPDDGKRYDLDEIIEEVKSWELEDEFDI